MYHNDRVLDTIKGTEKKPLNKEFILATEESEPLTKADTLANPNSSLDKQD
jgi:hypothetical protein